MRKEINENRHHDPRINYRGNNPTRLDNLTDAVFGIAITLLIFNLSNPNSFSSLITFTKTLPAFLISIGFLVLIWNEHLRFSEIYTLKDNKLVVLNTLFIALIIFYVYPLRFLTLFLTSFFFNIDIGMSIKGHEVPDLMIYYGFVAFALYFTVYLLYLRASKLKNELELNDFEIFYTHQQKIRLMIMFGVPLISIILTFIFKWGSIRWASIIGGMAYMLYTPAMMMWVKRYMRKEKEFEKPTSDPPLAEL
ncbi:MAG: TMEM175 family protein [Saprospiraceae bacterium]|nr:TMEM175 family protein [Saprospiraceae bacterium]